MTLYKKVSQIKYIKLKGENIKKHLVFKYTPYNEYLNRSTPSKKKKKNIYIDKEVKYTKKLTFADKFVLYTHFYHVNLQIIDHEPGMGSITFKYNQLHYNYFATFRITFHYDCINFQM
jgi:hypothetical protein